MGGIFGFTTLGVKVMKSLLSFRLLWGLGFGSFFLAGCENKEAPDQLTTVEGKVLRNFDNTPFAGVLMLVEPYSPGFGTVHFSPPVDSARTDANGHYSLHFNNQKGLYYAVSCDPDYTNRKLDFLPLPENGPKEPMVGGDQRRRPVMIGQANVVNYYPGRRAVALIRVQLKNTRFQRLLTGASNDYLNATRLDTVLTRQVYWGYIYTSSATLRRISPSGQTLQDSVISFFSLPIVAADTVRTTFRFVR